MEAIAGLEVGLPRNIDDIDAAWMTSVLHTSGAIASDSSVTSVVSEPFIAGGLLSLLFRSSLESDDPGCPATVIVKFPIDVPAQRAIADTFGSYRREVTFYREIAPRSTIEMPVVHAAMIDSDYVDYCIVMEDLGHLRQPDRVAGVTWNEGVAGIRALAAFHADWHGSPELTDLMDPFVSIGAPSQHTLLPPVARVGWPGAKLHAGHVLSPDVVEFGDMWIDRLGVMLDHMCTRPTLCHQDWRADNMFIRDGDGDEADGGVVVIDPQIVGVANGAFDIGYFISQSMERDVRGGRERELVQHYVDAMAERGHELDADRVFFDTRVAVGLCLMYGFASYAQYELLDSLGKEMTHKILRRGAEAITDLDALGAIRELPKS